VPLQQCHWRAHGESPALEHGAVECHAAVELLNQASQDAQVLLLIRASFRRFPVCLVLPYWTVVSLSMAVRQALPARTVARSSRYSKYTWCSSIACRYPCSYASTSSLRPWELFCPGPISPRWAAVEAWAYLSGALYFLSEARRQAYSPLPRPYVWLYERDCVGAGMRFLPGRPWLPRRCA